MAFRHSNPTTTMQKLSGALTRLAIGSALVLLAAGLAAAHESWLQPVAFLVDKPATQIARMTSGMGEHYPEAETAIERARVVKSGVAMGSQRLPLTPSAEREKSLELTWTPTQQGVATLWVDLAAKTLDLPDSLIDVYFDEIGASPALRKQWTDPAKPKQWRESYVKHAKTYVRVGDPNAPRPFVKNVGMALEILPDRDPTLLAAGDTLRVRVHYRGKLLPNFTIAAFREGGSKPGFAKTDASGKASIILPKTGAMLLAAVHLRRVHEKNLEWRSDFTSMTFPVRSR